jgi:hypothetical protein
MKFAVERAAGVVRALKGTAFQSCPQYAIELSVEEPRLLDEHVRHGAGGDEDPGTLHKFADTRLGDVGNEVKGRYQGADTGTEIAFVAGRKRGQISFVLRGTVPASLLESGVIRDYEQILDDMGKVSDVDHIRWQVRRRLIQILLVVHDNKAGLETLMPGIRGVSLLFG